MIDKLKQNECLKCAKRLKHIKVLEAMLKGERLRRKKVQHILYCIQEERLDD